MTDLIWTHVLLWTQTRIISDVAAARIVALKRLCFSMLKQNSLFRITILVCFEFLSMKWN
jgi:hypothetical protein